MDKQTVRKVEFLEWLNRKVHAAGSPFMVRADELVSLFDLEDAKTVERAELAEYVIELCGTDLDPHYVQGFLEAKAAIKRRFDLKESDYCEPS
jgi:hypothetical protein